MATKEPPRGKGGGKAMVSQVIGIRSGNKKNLEKAEQRKALKKASVAVIKGFAPLEKEYEYTDRRTGAKMTQRITVNLSNQADHLYEHDVMGRRNGKIDKFMQVVSHGNIPSIRDAFATAKFDKYAVAKGHEGNGYSGFYYYNGKLGNIDVKFNVGMKVENITRSDGSVKKRRTYELYSITRA